MVTPIVEETLDEAMETKRLLEEFAYVPEAKSLDVNEALEYAFEAEQNFNAITIALEQSNLAYYAENGVLLSEAVVTEAKAQKIFSKHFEKIAEWFKKALERLTSIWKAALTQLSKIHVANKAFVKLVKPHISKSTTVKYNGYDFKHISAFKPDNFTTHFDNNLKRNLPDNWVDDKKDEIISRVVGMSNVGVNDFKKKFRELLYFDKKERDYNAYDQLSYIEHLDSDKARVNKLYKPTSAYMRTLVGVFSSQKKFAAKCEAETLSKYVEVARYNCFVLNYAFNLYVKALVDRANQARKICALALKQHESATEDTQKDALHLRESSLDSIFSTLA